MTGEIVKRSGLPERQRPVSEKFPDFDPAEARTPEEAIALHAHLVDHLVKEAHKIVGKKAVRIDTEPDESWHLTYDMPDRPEVPLSRILTTIRIEKKTLTQEQVDRLQQLCMNHSDLVTPIMSRYAKALSRSEPASQDQYDSLFRLAELAPLEEIANPRSLKSRLNGPYRIGIQPFGGGGATPYYKKDIPEGYLRLHERGQHHFFDPKESFIYLNLDSRYIQPQFKQLPGNQKALPPGK